MLQSVGYYSLVRAPAHAPAAILCTASPPQQQNDPKLALFENLISSLPNPSVELVNGENGRSLVATRDCEVGDSLLAVPKKFLLTAHRSGVIDGLQGQTDATWDATGDLREEVGEEQFKQGATWDVRLALAVFEGSAGSGGVFWDQYRTLLPPPPKMSHPLTLPESLLAEVQDDEVVAKTRALRQKLEELYPVLNSHAVHPATAAYEAMGAPMDQIPLPLQYAYALVVSRCFTMSDGDTFAFVPFLDMADHEAQPTANFASDARGFVLKALRPIAAGEPVSICYGEDYTSRRLFEQYGFCPEQGTAADARTLRELVASAAKEEASGVASAIAGAPATPLAESAMGMQALGAAFAELAESPLSTEERRGAIFDALTGEERAPNTDDGSDAEPSAAPAEGVDPAALLAAARWQLTQFPTSLLEDEQLLRQLEEAAESAAVDGRVYAVLSYRLARKRLLAYTEQVLGTFLGV